MSIKSQLSFSPLTERVFWGRVNQKTGMAVGEQRDVTSNFLQVMECKFPINTTQNISINGENAYRVIVVGMEKEVTINGKVIE